MINDGINDVPPNTIVVFRGDEKGNNVSKETIFSLVKKSEKKRDWFTPNFYRCLPLIIGNQYGFTICSQFDFEVEWNGDISKEGVKFWFTEDLDFLNENKYPHISSHFGSGIITINPPFALRTPSGVNLMTINPPNHVLPNITVMTGVVETDNLRRNFTFNLKIQIPHIKLFIPAGTPLAAFIPIPRYFADKFSLKFEDEVFGTSVLEEEHEAGSKANELRDWTVKNTTSKVDRQYFKGVDVLGNTFKDHQGPND